MFWVKNFFAEILPWAEQSGTQFFSLSNLLVVSKACATIRFQLFDIWWSSLDVINDFKAISKIAFFRFGEINRSLFWVFTKKIIYFLYIYKRNNQPKKYWNFFLKKLKKMTCLFHRNGKMLFWKWPWNNLYIQTWPSNVKKLKTDRRTHFWNY